MATIDAYKELSPKIADHHGTFHVRLGQSREVHQVRQNATMNHHDISLVSILLMRVSQKILKAECSDPSTQVLLLPFLSRTSVAQKHWSIVPSNQKWFSTESSNAEICPCKKRNAKAYKDVHKHKLYKAIRHERTIEMAREC